MLLFCGFLSGCGNNSQKVKGADIAIKDVYSYKEDNTLGDVGGYVITVKNDVLTFNFADHIVTSEKAEWFVSRDVEGNDTIPSKTIVLDEGQTLSNFACVHVTAGKETKSYAVLIHRHFNFNVTFLNQISHKTVKTMKVEEDSLIREEDIPELPVITGYEVAGWNYDFKQVVTRDLTIGLRADGRVCVTALYPNGGSFNGSTEPKTIYLKYDLEYTLPEPTKEGHTFDGWYTKLYGGTKIPSTGVWNIDAKSEALFAHWIINTYTVKWMNGTSELASETYNYGDTPTYKGETPQKAGDAQYSYTFKNWSPEIKPVTANTSYYAQFTSTVNKYTVTWKNWDGQVLETDTDVPYGTYPHFDGNQPSKPSDAQYTYTFSNWSPALSNVSGDVEYVAQFNSVVNKYQVRFLNYDGSLLQEKSVDYGTSVTYTGATPTRDHQNHKSYTFKSWDKDISSVTSNMDVYAEYNVFDNYTFTFIDETSTTVTVPENSSIASMMPENTSTSISGNNETSYSWVFDGDYTYHENPNYRGIYYITYILNNGTNNDDNPISIYEDESIDLLDPSRSGYTFNGWYLDGETDPINTLTGITSNISLEAKWDPTQFSITYHVDGGTNHIKNPDSYTILDTIELKNPSKTGYTFNGWYLDSGYASSISSITNRTGDLDLYAKFTANTYNVTFNSNGGTYQQKLTVTLDSRNGDLGTKTFSVNQNSYFDPYASWKLTTYNSTSAFAGWYLNSGCTNKFSGTTTIEENVTLYAKWDVIQPSTTKYLSNEVTLRTPNRSSIGYTSNYKHTCYIPGDVTSIAYEIYIPSNSGSVATVFYLFSITRNEMLVQISDDGTKTGTVNVQPGEIIGVSGTWNQGSTENCTISVNSKSTNRVLSSNNRSAEVVYDALSNAPAVEKRGYDFLGWYDSNDNRLEDYYNFDSDKDLIARWQLSNYQINYHLDGGTNDENNPLTYTTEDSFTFLSASKTGYTFDGWYTSPEFTTQSQITGISANSVGDVDVYAKFTPNEYTLTLSPNGGDISPVVTFMDGDDVLETYELTISEHCYYAPTPKEGFIFAGWYIDQELTELFNFSGSVTHDLTLYAKWLECDNDSIYIESTPEYNISINGTNEQIIAFVPLANRSITFTSISDLDLFGTLYDENHNVLISSDDISDTDLDFFLTYNLQAGKVYYLAVKGNMLSTIGDAIITISNTGECYIDGTTYSSDYSITVQYGAEYVLCSYGVMIDGTTVYELVGWFDDDDNQYYGGTWLYEDDLTLHAVWIAI